MLQIEVIRFEAQDVISASAPNCTYCGPDHFDENGKHIESSCTCHVCFPPA